MTDGVIASTGFASEVTRFVCLAPKKAVRMLGPAAGRENIARQRSRIAARVAIGGAQSGVLRRKSQ